MATPMDGEVVQVLAKREWISCGSPSGGQSGGNWLFRVLQWNTLADALSPSSPDSNFLRSPPHCLEWSYRGPQLIREVLRSQADIACLEEVDHFHDFFLPELNRHGYAGLWAEKIDSPCLKAQPNSGPDGCALLYRTSQFTLIETRTLVLNDDSGGASHQVAILARLQPVLPDLVPVCVAVTHLKAKTGYDSLRLAQGRHLQSELAEFASGRPTIICGDFNAPPSEPVYSRLCAPQPGLVLESAYAQAGGEPAFTTWKHRPGKEAKHTIDYIWYTPGGLDLRQIWGIPAEKEIGEDALPAPNYPSDHVSLCAAFTFSAPP